MASLWICLVVLLGIAVAQHPEHSGEDDSGEEGGKHHGGEHHGGEHQGGEHHRGGKKPHDWHSNGFIPTYLVTDVCGKTIHIKDHMSAVKLMIDWQDSVNHTSTECGLNIRAADGQRLMVKFLKMHFQEKECHNYIEIYDGKTKLSATQPLLTKRCGNSLPFDLISSDQDAFVMFHGEKGSEECTFLLMVTPFHYGKCDDMEFECNNARCIDRRLVCNRYDNCGDHSDDHAMCDYEGRHHKHGFFWRCIIGGAVAIIVLGSAIAIVVKCCRKHRRCPRNKTVEKKTAVLPAISAADKKAIEAGLSANMFLQQQTVLPPINPPSYTDVSGVPVFSAPSVESRLPESAPPTEEKKQAFA